MPSGLRGDWDKAGIFLRSLPAVISKTARAGLNKDAEAIKQRMIDHIENQDLPWKPLSPITIKLKGHDKIYIETGELKESIGIIKIDGRIKYTLFVGWQKGQTHKASGNDINELMIWLEYGTSKMPARPLIRPVKEEMKSIVKKGVIESLASIFKGGL